MGIWREVLQRNVSSSRHGPCSLEEFRCDPNSKWWSHKFNGPGVSFEVVCDPVYGKIRWINGPQPVSVHDITFLRGGKKGKMNTWNRSSLYFNVPESVKLVGDSAYAGQPDKIKVAFEAADVLVQYDIENGHSLFEV
eukprot:CCRYP_002431-RA/>CCRYP_002431-RA protein AED:0.29 eAED:0.34 QI:0/0/0/1/0/0/4/0/136